MNVNDLIEALQQLADAHPGETIAVATSESWPRPQPFGLQVRRGGDSPLTLVIDLGKRWQQ